MYYYVETLLYIGIFETINLVVYFSIIMVVYYSIIIYNKEQAYKLNEFWQKYMSC